MEVSQQYGFKDLIDPSGKRVRSMTRTEISQGKLLNKQSRSPLGEQNCFARMHRPSPSIICLFGKDPYAVALWARLKQLLQNQLFSRLETTENRLSSLQIAEDTIQIIRQTIKTIKETNNLNRYNDDPYMLASIKKCTFGGKIQAPSGRTTFQNSVETLGTSTEIEELIRSRQSRDPAKNNAKKDITKNARVALELTHFVFPQHKTAKFESLDVNRESPKGVWAKSNSTVCDPEKKYQKKSNIPVVILNPVQTELARLEENQRILIKKNSFDKLEGFFAEKASSGKKQGQIRQRKLVKQNQFEQMPIKPIQKESHSPKVRVQPIKFADNGNDFLRGSRQSFRSRGRLNSNDLFEKLRANDLKKIKLRRMNSAREPIMQLPLISKNRQTQSHDEELYSLQFLKAFQFHQNQINKLILFVLNSKKEIVERPKAYTQEKLCYFLIYRYLYERNRVLNTLRKGQNYFKLSGCSISDHVVMRAIQSPDIKEICRTYMEETQLLKEEFQRFYQTIEKNYPKKERFKQCKNMDKVSQQISQILMEEVYKRFKKFQTQVKEQKRLKQMMEVIFLLSELSSKTNEQILLQKNLNFLEYCEANMKKVFKTALYLRKVGSSKKF